MVLHEVHQPRSNSSSRGSKKNRAKNKMPQRGLGVAQLEKLRIEEQQKKSPLAFLNAPPCDPNSLVASVFNSSMPQGRELFLPAMSYSENNGFLISNATVGSEKINDLGNSRYRHLFPIQMVNSAARAPILSSDILQMEPPSNQNYNSSYIVSSFQAEEKKKREESVAMYGKLPAYIEEGTSSSSSDQIASRSLEFHTKKRNRHNGGSVDKEFLAANSRSKHPMVILPDERLEHHELSLLQSHELLQSSSQQNFYYFFPVRSAVHKTDEIEQGAGLPNDVDTILKL